MTDGEAEDRVLRGNCQLDDIPVVPNRIIQLFVCTTGTDFVKESDALTQLVYPKLQEYCRDVHGVDFQVVDFHWGLTPGVYWDDHSGFEFMLNETTGVDSPLGSLSLVLLGQKNGRTSLPRSIPRAMYDRLRDTLRRHKNRETRTADLLDQWYRLDENHIPDSYFLKKISENIPNITSEESDAKQTAEEDWKYTEAELLRLLKKAAHYCQKDGDLDKKSYHQYIKSDLEKLTEACTTTEYKSLVVDRTIVDIKNYINDPQASMYADLHYDTITETLGIHQASETRLESLKNSFIPNVVHEDNIMKFNVLWKCDDVISPDLHEDYFHSLCNGVRDKLTQFIDDCMAEHDKKRNSPLLTEVLTHFDNARVTADVESGSLADDVASYLDHAGGTRIVISRHEKDGPRLMSAMISKVLSRKSEDSCTIIRFIGLTENSMDIVPLLSSVCQQISYCSDTPCPQLTSDNYTTMFAECLMKIPQSMKIAMFLDGIDKLNADFSWLPKELPTNVNMILTVSSTVVPLDELNAKFGSDTIIVDYHATAIETLKHTLMTKHRRLTDAQGQSVAALLRNTNSEVIPVLDLVAHQLVTLQSSMSIDDLPTDVEYLLDRILSHAEERFGRVTVANSLSLLAAAADDGLSDMEINVLLTNSDNVLSEVFEDFVPAVQSIPPIIWLQLRRHLDVLFTRKLINNSTVLIFSHPLISMFVSSRYLTNEEMKLTIHSRIADFYLGKLPMVMKDVPSEQMSENDHTAEHIFEQPCSAEDIHVKFNKRKFVMLPQHLHESKRFDELDRLVLCNFEWIYHKSQEFSLNHVLDDYSLSASSDATLVAQALQLSNDILSNGLHNLSQEIVGRLLPYYSSHPKIRELINQCDTKGLRSCALVPTYPYDEIPGTPLQFTFTPSCNTISSICIASNGRSVYIKSCDDTQVFRYSMSTGKQKDVISASSGELYITPDTHHILLLDHENHMSLKLHKRHTGKFIGQIIAANNIQGNLKGKYIPNTICVSNDRVCALAKADDTFLCIAEIPSCIFLQILQLNGTGTICNMTEDWKYVFCNANSQLHVYEVNTTEYVCSAPIPHAPNSIVFTSTGSRGFISTEKENKVLTLLLNNGRVQLSYRVVLEDLFETDTIKSLVVSHDDTKLCVQGATNIVVYDLLKERVLCHISRPEDIPDQFKLPSSHYVDIKFTKTQFSADDKFVLGSIFRYVYIWDAQFGTHMGTIQAPIGLLDTLVMTSHKNQLITHNQGSADVQVWKMENVVHGLRPIDKLPSAVTQICISETNKLVFASCRNFNEISVIDTTSGTVIDTLTHGGNVTDFAITPTGSHLMVSTESSAPDESVNVWDVKQKVIIYKFGNAPGFCVCLNSLESIVFIGQDEQRFKAPYAITQFSAGTSEPNVIRYTEQLKFLLAKPFATQNDRYLVTFTASKYIETDGVYTNASVFIVDLEQKDRVCEFQPSSFREVANMVSVLNVRPCSRSDDSIALLYLTDINGDDDSGSQDDNDEKTYGLLILNIQKGVIETVVESIFGSNSVIDQSLLISKDFRFAVEKTSWIFDIVKGQYVKKITGPGSSPCAIALGGAVVVYYEGSDMYVVRVSDDKTIAKCNVHGKITCVLLANDDRTLFIGTEDGKVPSYVIIDPDMDDVAALLGDIESRTISDVDDASSSSSQAAGKGSQKQSRPRTAGNSTPSCVLYAVKPELSYRPKSDTSLHQINRLNQLSVI